MQYTNKAYLLIGGNKGNRFVYLKQALDLINKHCGNITKASPVYETAPWGKSDQPLFLNQALELQTNYDAIHLMKQLLDIEEQIGRKRTDKYGPRIIDIDILLYNEERHATNELTVPHAELQNRRFALQPLADIAPDINHPLLNKPIRRLLEDCTDQLQVKVVNGEW